MLNFNPSSAKLSSQTVPGRLLSRVLHDTRGWRGHGGLPCVGTSESLVDSLGWVVESDRWPGLRSGSLAPR